MRVEEMIAVHPHVRGEVNSVLTRCIEACLDCAQVCGSCADACLGETRVAELVQCIRLNMDCEDVCLTTGRLAARRSGGDVPLILAQLEACRLACERCATECERHAGMHEHCRICAETCRQCQVACEAALENLAASRTH